MNTRPLEHAVGATTVADVLLAGWGAFARAWRVIRHRRQVEELTQLDDHMLRDIGVTRADVTKALAAPLSQDPSVELAALRLAGRRGGSFSQRSNDVSDSRQSMSRGR